MKRIIIIWIGLIFLLVDTKIDGLFFYPAFEPFDTNAPITVDMIIGHLIGDSVKLDLFSDLIAYALIIFITCRIVGENQKESQSAGAFRAFLLGCLALILYVANFAMPFFLNGRQRYNVGFFLYIIYNLIKCLATIQAGFVCCGMANCRENHAWNNVVEIFLMLAAFAGFIRAMSYFYDLFWTTCIYYVVQIFFTILYTVMFWLRRSYVNSGTPIQP